MLHHQVTGVDDIIECSPRVVTATWIEVEIGDVVQCRVINRLILLQLIRAIVTPHDETLDDTTTQHLVVSTIHHLIDIILCLPVILQHRLVGRGDGQEIIA